MPLLSDVVIVPASAFHACIFPFIGIRILLASPAPGSSFLRRVSPKSNEHPPVNNAAAATAAVGKCKTPFLQEGGQNPFKIETTFGACWLGVPTTTSTITTPTGARTHESMLLGIFQRRVDPYMNESLSEWVTSGGGGSVGGCDAIPKLPRPRRAKCVKN